MDSKLLYHALLELCVLASRSPDRFYRKGTRWITVHEFFVCENMLLVMPEIDPDEADSLARVFTDFRQDQIFNGLKAPSQEAVA